MQSWPREKNPAYEVVMIDPTKKFAPLDFKLIESSRPPSGPLEI